MAGDDAREGRRGRGAGRREWVRAGRGKRGWGDKGGVHERSIYRIGRLGEGLLVHGGWGERWVAGRNEQGRNTWVLGEQKGWRDNVGEE